MRRVPENSGHQIAKKGARGRAGAARENSVITVPPAVVQQPRVETNAGTANSMTKKLNEVPVDNDATQNVQAAPPPEAAEPATGAVAEPVAAPPAKVERSRRGIAAPRKRRC